MNAGIELIRIIAVILITFTHTRNDLTEGWGYFIIEKLPTYGTAILSIVSGYLYFSIIREKANLFKRKIKSLAIPYLIANGLVLCLVLVAYYVFGVNFLNRLSFDYKLITEGLFALNSPPINPPTYFIRDIFIIFCIISLMTQREWKSLFVILPFLLFGNLILRTDVAFLFCLGILYGRFRYIFDWKCWFIIAFTMCIIFSLVLEENYLKFPVAFSIFLIFANLKFPYYKTSNYSYLLHLYHSPLMVVSYPVIGKVISNQYWSVFLQISTSMLCVYLLYLLVEKYKFLKILVGYR